MADNDQLNDEYQFSELDALGTDTTNQAEGEDDAAASKRVGAETNIRRNALIVVILVILAMIIYKFLGSFFSSPEIPVQKTKSVDTAKKSEPKPEAPEIKPLKPVVSEPKPQPQQTSVSANVEQKLSALELSQQSTRSDVSSVSNQLGGISANMNDLSTQIAKLNDALTSINTKLEQQSREIDLLMTRTKPQKKRPVTKQTQPAKKYYIQAVIPGRAWLIAQNGATLTVREGTAIPGYGTIKLIDPLQGRITTSSGQIIRFSQDDS